MTFAGDLLVLSRAPAVVANGAPDPQPLPPALQRQGPKKITVRAQNPSPLFLAGLRSRLDGVTDIEVRSEAEINHASAPASAAATTADVLLVSDPLPWGDLTGTSAVVVYSSRSDLDFVRRALASGAMGYVLTTDPIHWLASAIRTVAIGNAFISPGLSSAVRETLLAHGTPVLTPRQISILSLIGQGHSTKSIANLLAISPRTVEVHRLQLLRRLSARTAAELVRVAIRHGLIEA